MAIHAAFFKDKNFTGDFDTRDLDDSHRYRWVKYGSNFGDEISSFRAHAFGSHHGTVYAMTERDFTGKFISLNIKRNKFARWSSVGAALDDNIESVLMVNRNENEFELSLREVVITQFDTTLDILLGTQIFREGRPDVFTTFWPAYDPTHNFASIGQNLYIKLDNWPDYEARVQYDIFFSLNKSGHLQLRVKWMQIWVDSGLMSNHVLNELKPRLLENISFLTENLRFELTPNTENLPAGKFKGVYLLPGPLPTTAIGDKGDTKSNSTLVLVL